MRVEAVAGRAAIGLGMTTLEAQEIVERPAVVSRRVAAFLKRVVLFLMLGALISILMAWALGSKGRRERPTFATLQTTASLSVLTTSFKS